MQSFPRFNSWIRSLRLWLIDTAKLQQGWTTGQLSMYRLHCCNTDTRDNLETKLLFSTIVALSIPFPRTRLSLDLYIYIFFLLQQFRQKFTKSRLDHRYRWLNSRWHSRRRMVFQTVWNARKVARTISIKRNPGNECCQCEFLVFSRSHVKIIAFSQISHTAYRRFSFYTVLVVS